MAPFRYGRKWYECANQTDAFIFQVGGSAAGGGAGGAGGGIEGAVGGGDSGGQVSFTPSFTYHGFRFVELSFLQVLPDGSEVPLGSDASALFPFGATLVAHRTNSALVRLATLGELGDEGDEGDHDTKATTAGSNGEKGETRETTRETRKEGGRGAYDEDDNATMSASAVLTAIFNATLSSHVSNLWSIPTDCPQREKRGWMADAGISSGSLATFYDSLAFHSNFLRIIRDNQQKLCTTQPQTTINGPCKAPAGKGDPATWFNGSVPDATPFSTSPYGGNPGTTDWQVAYVMIAHSILEHYGPRAHPVLAELWDSLDLFMDYLDKLVDPATGLLLQVRETERETETERQT